MEVSKDYIDKNANDAATSPKNNLPDPSEVQKKSGNYKKGHVKIHGLDISIENPKGSIRSGTDHTGKEWSIKLKNHYGYINGNNIGKDGDPVDIFIGPNPNSEKIFIVNQKNKEDNFDEHKVLLGWEKFQDAIGGYLDNYEKGWDMIMSVHQTTLNNFKNWLKSGKIKTPYKD
jgi:hypothetical protein